MATKNHWAAGDAEGADVQHPTRVSKVPALSYKHNLYRGAEVLAHRTDVADYGQHGAQVPASVDCRTAGGPDGTGLSDFPTTVADPVKAGIAAQGLGDHAANPSTVADLDRKISTKGAVADHSGAGSARSRQAGSVDKLRGSLPGKLGVSTEQPVRKP
jgi:hypothetical protein